MATVNELPVFLQVCKILCIMYMDVESFDEQISCLVFTFIKC
jgi:hypothetical protein